MIRRIVVFFISLVFLSFAFITIWMGVKPARAQSPVRLSNLEVDIWPEYDRPGVLVIYRVTLPPEISLPVDLTLRIPAEVGEPNAVAAKQMDGALYSLAYDRQVSGDWSLINFTATMPELQVEYYDPSLELQGASRHYEYQWPGDYAVDALMIQVQQPYQASGLRTSPALGGGIVGQDGLAYYNAQVGALEEGQTFNLAVDYEKATDTLTVESLQVLPSAPVSSSTSDWQSQISAVLPWGLGFLGLALIVGGGLWYWKSGQRADDKPKPRRRRSSATGSEVAPAEGHIYCHQCGKRAAPGDRFCRTCGARLRLE